MSIFNNTPEDFKQAMAHMDDLGGPMTFNHYAVGWAHAMDTPFQWTKQVASHFGGTRNGLVISWPARIKDKGGIRTEFSSVIDIYPTILEAVDVQSTSMLNGVPQRPIESFSMVYTFDNPKAKSVHRTQYFEIFSTAQSTTTAGSPPPHHPASPESWVRPCRQWRTINGELYNVEQDFSEANDLAAKEPKRLHQLQDLFWAEAGKYNVLPLDNSKAERFDVSLRPSLTRGRTEFTYYPGMVRIPEGSAPISKTSRTASRRMSRFLMAA